VRLEKLESAIAESAERRDRLVAEARNIREQLRGPAGEHAWHIHAPTLRALVEQRACLVELRERRAAADRTALDCERKFAVAREELGPGWTTERIEAGDISYAARRRFSGTAESLLAARVRRRALRRKCRRLAGACRDLKESLAESLHDLGGLSVDAAVAQAREQLDAFNRIAELRLRGVELSGRIDSLKRQRERVTLQLNLPRWVYLVLGIFGFMGVMLAGWGLVAGLATNGIAGAIYAMLGITTWGLAWGLKLQYEGDARERLGEIDAAAADAVEEERRLRDSMHDLAGFEADSADSAGLICRASTRIGELVDLAASQRRLRGMRKSLAAARKRLATSRREVATAAQNWRELLSKIGFTEVLSVDEALAAWEKLAEASERLAAWNAARRDAESAAAIGEIYLKRIEELAGALPDGPADLREPAEIVSIWQEQLALLDRRQAERRVQCAMLRDRKRQARRHNRRARWLKIRRDALLVQGGAASRDEFEERARSFVRRVELSDQLRDSRRDLDAICDDHADLAIVEEDLLRVDPRQNEECIEMLRRELEDLRRDLDRYSESLADVRHEVDLLENDRQATRVRFDVRQTEEQMRVLAGQWAAYESAFQVLAQIRRDYERSHQPRSLALTADFLSRITNGRYRRVWSPLGERRLIVDDEPGRSFPMHSLSRSTREQLALAVRLALVRKLAAQGIDLPLILDDVLVNFDEQRARSTIDLLLELAGQGQQVLFFTCHNHLAQLFASRGIEPIWLPGRPAPSEVHEEKRLAG
jgi:DNA repair exonuclease SbcCD ATPase subunit